MERLPFTRQSRPGYRGLMKYFLRIITLLALLIPSLTMAADPSRQELDAFGHRVETLVKEGNLKGILALYHWASTPETLVDIQTQAWIDALDRGGLESLEIVSVADTPTRAGLSPEDISGRVWNGKRYAPNLPIAGVLVAEFAPKDKPGYTLLRPIGVDTAGKIAFAGIAVSPVQK